MGTCRQLAYRLPAPRRRQPAILYDVPPYPRLARPFSDLFFMTRYTIFQPATLVLVGTALLISPVLIRLAAWLPRQIDASLPPAQRMALAQQAVFSLVGALLAATCGARYGLTVPGFAATVLVLALLTLAWIDAQTGLLPDALTLPLLWLGLLVNLDHRFALLPDAVVGAAAGYLFFWLLYQIFFLITRREGLGYGDFKLLAALGAWLGWQALPGIVLAASITALVVTLIRRKRSGGDMRQVLHYGPYLAAAGIARLFWVF